MMNKENTIKLIKDFQEALEKSNTSIECIAYANKDGLIYSYHYNEPKERNIYSNSKSYTSLMTGIALDEGKIKLSDKLGDILKDEIDPKYLNKAMKITLRDLLTMSSGFNKQILMGDEKESAPEDWINYILSYDLELEPGSKMCYSNGDTYLVSRMVEKVYGRPFIDIVTEKIFNPLNMYIKGWDRDKLGHVQAASGLRISIEEQIKLGILCINNGVYKGKRIVSEDYIKQISTKQIDSMSWDWGNYSYQFWLIPTGDGYRADGAFGQLTCIFPKQDVIIAIQRKDNSDPKETVDLLHKYIFNKL